MPLTSALGGVTRPNKATTGAGAGGSYARDTGARVNTQTARFEGTVGADGKNACISVSYTVNTSARNLTPGGTVVPGQAGSAAAGGGTF